MFFKLNDVEYELNYSSSKSCLEVKRINSYDVLFRVYEYNDIHILDESIENDPIVKFIKSSNIFQILRREYILEREIEKLRKEIRNC